MSKQKLCTEIEGSQRVWERRNKNITLDEEQVKEGKEMEKYYEKKSGYMNICRSAHTQGARMPPT